MSPLALSLRLLQAQPDERLLGLARAGHEPAFEALVRRYRRPLLAYCRRIAAPPVSAEDVVQQALMQAWRALSTGAEVRDARAWLYRIVHNAAVSAGRGADEASAELGDAISAIDIDRLVEQRMAAREALASLAALPKLQREVMLGTAVEGRSHDEVAAALGLTSGSVRGLLYRARSALRAAAAASIPPPLLEWAARQKSGASAGIIEAVAGGGSAGVAGAMLKGGAIVTVAGALAGTAAVVVTHPARRHAPMHSAAPIHTPRAKASLVALVASPGRRTLVRGEDFLQARAPQPTAHERLGLRSASPSVVPRADASAGAGSDRQHSSGDGTRHDAQSTGSSGSSGDRVREGSDVSTADGASSGAVSDPTSGPTGPSGAGTTGSQGATPSSATSTSTDGSATGSD